MSLRSLSLLVLAMVAGTAASVRWYLEADAVDRQRAETTVPVQRALHVPLPMRAEPARQPSRRVDSPTLSGVAQRGQAPAPAALELRVEPQAHRAPSTASAGAFVPAPGS